jgi:hypothetical protein
MATELDHKPRHRTGAQRLAWLLDDVFRIPGTKLRFGLDPILGLIPGGGDVAGGALSAYIIMAAARLGAPPPVLIRMGMNVIVDTVLGGFPVVGDLFDAGWKANRRNAVLLEQYAEQPAPVTRRSRMVLVAVLALLALFILGMAAATVLILRWLLSVSTG